MAKHCETGRLDETEYMVKMYSKIYFIKFVGIDQAQYEFVLRLEK